jgi:2-oxoglutarate dehydrogenase E2 component (dihydrolipoamide succinyltransferase)
MKIEVKIPVVGESVQEAVLAQWYKRDGEMVRKGDILFLIETDKVTLEIAAEAEGRLKILVPEGETVAVNTVVGTIDAEASAAETPEASLGARREEPAPPVREERREKPPQPAAERALPETESKPPAPEPGRREAAESHETLSPSVRRLINENRLDPSMIKGTGPGGRITKGDVLLFLEETSERKGEAARSERPSAGPGAAEEKKAVFGEENVTRKPMSRIRQRIAERLLEARQNTAMLTTFNEIDMSSIQAIRARFKESFRAKYGVSLGLMSFFVKACVVALKEFPEVNAFIEGRDIVYHHYFHIGMAVGAERGLVVPVIRHADRLGFSEIEQSIMDYVRKIKENRLELSDLEGGTFTISNGGVYGSLLSTPILNTPQSGILGLHKIEDRPVVVGGEIVIRPMMYVALSYDHRIIDGAQAVTFLKRIKECIENPERIMMEI